MSDVAWGHREVVVVGGGLAGLTAGALLAHAGKRALVVEAHDKAAGYAASIEGGGYRFEPAIHLAMGGNESGPFGPGLEGHHQIVVQGAAPTDPSIVDQAELASHFVRLAQQVIPDLGDHVTHALGADHGPTGPTSLPLRLIGPVYGWDDSPSNSATNRLPQKTPIRGLSLAGHWAQPGHGVWTVMASGVQATRLILRESTNAGLYPISL